jgi:hypothetical protein
MESAKKSRAGFDETDIADSPSKNHETPQA